MRIAVLGSGDMGTAHARIYAGRLKKQVELAAVFSRDPARARTLAKEVGARPTTHAEEILRDDSIDAVDLCIPSAYHRKFAVQALDQGKHVFSETPLALTVSNADAMIAAARRNRRLLAVAQIMRFVAPYVRAKAEVASGRMGRPNIVVARRLSRPYWARKRRRPFREYGEPMLELSIHDIDVANWLLGRPKSVLASGVIGKTGVAEHVLLAISYRGSKAYIEGSAMMPRGFPFTTALRIQCERGVIRSSSPVHRGADPEGTVPRVRGGGTDERPRWWPRPVRGGVCRLCARHQNPCGTDRSNGQTGASGIGGGCSRAAEPSNAAPGQRLT